VTECLISKYLVALKRLVIECLPEDVFGLVTCAIQAIQLFKCAFVTVKKICLSNSLYTRRHQTEKSSERYNVTRSLNDNNYFNVI